MMRRSVSLWLLLSSLWVTGFSQTRRTTLVLQGGTLIDGTGAKPVPDAVVVIEGNRIQAAGPRSAVRVPPDATVINTTGKFIIPGLIDSHVHYLDWTGELFLYHGVTTVVDLGNYTDYIVALSDSINRGFDVGPRIFGAGEFLRSGAPPSPKEAAWVSPRLDSISLATPEEMRKKVREFVARGMKLVKAHDLTYEHLVAVADEAHKLGVPVAAHTTEPRKWIEGGMDYLAHHWGVPGGAIKNPVDFERYQDSRRRDGAKSGKPALCPDGLMDDEGMDELVELMVKRNVVYSPDILFVYKPFTRTAEWNEQANRELFNRNELQYVPVNVREAAISTFHRFRNPVRRGLTGNQSFTWMDELTPEQIQEYRTCYDKSLSFIRRFVKAGGIISNGTDTGGGSSIPGIGLIHEMEILEEAGMTPMQVIQATTVNTTKFLHMEKDLGTVEAGKLADVVVLSADPLASISNVHKIDTVIKDGKVFDRKFHKDYDTIIKLPRGEILPRGPVTYRGSPYYDWPLVTGVEPGLATEGSADLEITVEGIGFAGASVVRWVNDRLKTEYVSAERLKAIVPARVLRSPGTWPVTVESPQPGGGISNPYGLIVRFK